MLFIVALPMKPSKIFAVYSMSQITKYFNKNTLMLKNINCITILYDYIILEGTERIKTEKND